MSLHNIQLRPQHYSWQGRHRTALDTSQSPYTPLWSIIGEHTSGVVFWTGSGLSAEAGLPTWGKLRTILMDALTERINQLEASERGSLQGKTRVIRNESNNRRAFQLLRETLGQTTWRAIIRDAPDVSSTAPPPALYERIWQLHPHGLPTLKSGPACN